MNRQELIDTMAARSGEKAATADLLSAAPEIVGFDPPSAASRVARREPATGRRLLRALLMI